MGMFGRLFGRGKDKPEGPQPEGGTPAPVEPSAPPAGPEAAGEPRRKRGLFGKVADKLRGKTKKEEVPGETPPAAPLVPPAPPGPPAAPPTAGGGEGGEPGEGKPKGGKDYSDAPSSLTVRIPGTWVTSKRKWLGVVEGTLTGSQVVDFLRALDEGRENDAVQMVCNEFGDDGSFGAGVDVEESSWSTLDY